MSYQRSKNLNQKHKAIYESICKLGKATIYKVHHDTGIRPMTISNYMRQMVDHGLLETHPVSGRARFSYGPTEMTYEEFEKIFECEVEDVIPDQLLEAIETFELTDEQWRYINANPTLSRSQLCKKLGIPRTLLLAAIDRRMNRERG